MKRSTGSICLTGSKTRKPRMYVVVGIVVLLLSSSTLSLQQASVVSLAGAAPGDLDSTFGIDGKVTTDFFGNRDEVHALSVQSDGKIVAAGTMERTSVTLVDFDFAVARYNTNGSLDPTFGFGGKVTTDFGSGESANALAIQPDGKILAAGGGHLARYNADGSLDVTFGSFGKVTFDFGTPLGVKALALQSDGKIVLGGQTFIPDGIRDYDFKLARYDANGGLDSTFGSGGIVTTDFFLDTDDLSALILQPDGKIVAAGSAWDFFHVNFALARYNCDGSLDSTFGIDGKVATDFWTSGAYARALVLQPNGRLVAAGYAYVGGGPSDFALTRYNSDGTPDVTFGIDGRVTTDFFGNYDGADSLALQPDGKLVAAGSASHNPTPGPDFGDFTLVRYNGDGSRDMTFGMNGKITTNFLDWDFATAIVLGRDRKIIAGGISNYGTYFSNFALARYEGDAFDTCLEDDNSGNLLQFNSTTGEYQFVDCRKVITLSGIGKVTNDPSGCKITLQDSGPTPKRPDRSVLVQVNRCTHVAIASIRIFSTGSFFSITDSDIMNNTCACR